MTFASLSAVTRFLHRVAAHDAHGATDQDLLDRFTRHRDEAAFADLVRRHGPMVLGVCRRVLRHEQDAEDAFQAAFLVLVRKAASIRRHASVGGWLFRVAYRLALHARAGGARRERPADPADLALAAAARGDLWPDLDEEVQRLPEQYRSAAVLCYVEGRSQAEAARLLRTTPGAVNSRLKRAREILRRRLGHRALLLWATGAGALGRGEAATAAVSPELVRLTARAAVRFAADAGPCGASALALTLARGALRAMRTTKLKLLSLLALTVALLTAGALALPVPALGDDPAKGAPRGKGAEVASPDKPAPPFKGKPVKVRACVLLWMNGGPSQFETFDLKPGRVTGGPFRPIPTAAKGVEISEHLPKLAKLGNHLAIIRSLTHREGDHMRSTYLMRTGRSPDGQTDYPALGSVLAKELGDAQRALPRHVRIGGPRDPVALGYGPGYLGLDCAPVVVGGTPFGAGDPGPPGLPPVEEFEPHAKGRGAAMRKAVARAFDLADEKPAVRDAYGRNSFGEGCLLARRLVERGVPVVEVTLGGWDTHANAFGLIKKLSRKLDSGWASLLKDLHDRGLLDSTLIVWMGEFGRTPRINAAQGRDHWPFSCCAVLAGRGIKGGQAIGKTDADGMRVAERPVTPPELLATVYQALGIDPTRTYRSNQNQDVPLVEKGTKAVREALR
jgi:RNA polymerase sigma factor (sigma-70 family)